MTASTSVTVTARVTGEVSSLFDLASTSPIADPTWREKVVGFITNLI